MEKVQGHSKAKWADIIGVSRSGYYSWLRERGHGGFIWRLTKLG